MNGVKYQVYELVTREGAYEIDDGALYFLPIRGSEGEVELRGDALPMLPEGVEITAILYEIILPHRKQRFVHEFEEPVVIEYDHDAHRARLVCMDNILVGWYPTADIFEDGTLRGEVTQFEA